MEREPLDRPILFSGPMVRAILEGRKTQTRRVVRLPKYPSRWPWEPTTTGGPKGGELLHPGSGLFAPLRVALWNTRTGAHRWCPHGDPGDRLWVRETWYCDHAFAGDHKRSCSGCVRCWHTDADRIADWRRELYYRADGEPQWEAPDGPTPWKPSIHMPRWASRLMLEVVEVRVRRLQEISEEDAEAEGVLAPMPAGATLTDNIPSPRRLYAKLWDSINGKRAPWASNPWVWSLTFKRVAAGRRAA